MKLHCMSPDELLATHPASREGGMMMRIVACHKRWRITPSAGRAKQRRRAAGVAMLGVER
jgi:hypothetical protein